MDTNALVKPSPKPYPNKGTLKAFVLGCDPTATNSKKNETPKVFEYVFNIGGKDKRYFAGILRNLESVKLSLDNVYIQNLHSGYLATDTSQDKKWHEKVKSSIPERKQEFDKIDPSGTIPVLLTSHELYKVLLTEGEAPLKPKELYDADDIVINSRKNKLGRPLIPFYRHLEYSLSKRKEYFVKVAKMFEKTSIITN